MSVMLDKTELASQAVDSLMAEPGSLDLLALNPARSMSQVHRRI